MTATIIPLAPYLRRASLRTTIRGSLLAAIDAELAELEASLHLARARRDALPVGDRRWLRAHVDVVRLVELWSTRTEERGWVLEREAGRRG